MGELSAFEVGQTVEVQDGKIAIVHFVGSTEFAAGDWIGVVLDDATGKNDGSVKGQRYFTCEPGHGMFVRPSAASIIGEPTAKPKGKTQPRANGVATKGHLPSMAPGGLRRQSVLDPGASKRQSINAGSPTPGTRAAASTKLASPSKSPTKQLSSSVSSGNASRLSTSSTTAKAPAPATRPSRMSMAPPSMPSAKPARPSIAETMNGSTKPSGNGSVSGSRGPARRMSLRPSAHAPLSSVAGTSQASGRTSPSDSLDLEALSPTSQVQESEARGPLSASVSASSALSPVGSSTNIAPWRGRSPPKAATRAPAASSREAEDLKTKIRILEKKRQEDREKLKALEKAQGERDKFEAIIHKLQSKYQPQQQEISDLRKQVRDEEAKVRSMETQQVDIDTVVEVATLDREMAEETAESLRTELDALRQKHEETQLEVEILREENQELSKEMSPEEKTSQGWLQMERSNERLREALMRLRDVTQQQESDLRAQVEELQNDLQDLAGTKDECLHTKDRLAQSETIIENLKQQLETALGAEEMIEELSEKNFALSQKVEKLEADVEELENLKEISDEIEINHTATEKQMQDEIDFNESSLAEQKRKSALQDETIQDLQYTVTRFHDLVVNMQGDLQDMKASQQSTEAEANELSDRSKAMMDLNMKLQVSASKAQTKAIDLELGKMDAQEAAEHLSIIQRFLPESFSSERNSVFAFLRFRRVGFKASLIHRFVKERINGPAPGSQEDIFSSCELLEGLAWISCMCNRFVNFIKMCSLESFEKLAGALYDLEPVERAFSGWIDGLKKDELKEKQCVEQLQRSIALMTHLAEIHITDGLDQYADDIQMRASMLQSHLDSAATALSRIRLVSQEKAAAVNSDVETGDDDQDVAAEGLIRKVDDLISQIRSAKVISNKAIRHLEDLRSRSLTLVQTTIPVIEQTQSSTSQVSLSIRSIGFSIARLFNEEGRTASITLSEISATTSSDGSSFSSLTSKIAAAMTQLQAFYSLTSSLTQTVEVPAPSPPLPWQLLAQKLRDEATASATQEAEVMKLKEEVQEGSTALAVRERTIEEMTVKVEVLEKRVGESGSRKEQVRELEAAVQASRAKEKEFTFQLKTLQRELQSLERERDSWKKGSNGPTVTAIEPGHFAAANMHPSASTLARISQLEKEIATLQSSVRYLRRQTHAHHIDSSLTFLNEPLTTPQRPPQSLLQSEARDVLKEMLHLVTRPGNQMVKLKVPPASKRLKWRPAKETTAWQTSTITEEWEAWRGWKDDVSRRAAQAIKLSPRTNADRGASEVLAKMHARLPQSKGMVKEGTREVRIVKPGEWDAIQEIAGVGVT